MEAFYTILGLAMIYSIVHFFILQKKAMSERTTYEQVVSWVAIVSIVFIMIDVMYGY